MSLHLLMSAGRGPQECAWALARLLHRLEADAARQGLTTHRVQTVPGDRPDSYRSALIRISGGDAEAFAASWTGTLCWQAPSPYRASTGRKNWYVVARPCQLDSPATTFAEADVDIVACRTGGPGGQHRNKASTAVRATHRPSGIVVVVDTERQFSLNRRLALQLLRQRITRGDENAERAVVTARWRIHDELVRGDPTRVERPEPPGREPAPPQRTRQRRGGPDHREGSDRQGRFDRRSGVSAS
ncbi:peptide chain release factor H [Micromonospora peucetia]|uniref:peptide chain release factor H n=1 Tax=Micromonospora peucetia TaxID=47871 RepID=UPI00398CE60B